MYDTSKTLTVEGVVRQFVWQAPHIHILIKTTPATTSPGSSGEWDIEAPAPNILIRQKWNKLTLKAGDRITVTTHPMRSSEAVGVLVSAVVNGVTMYGDAQRPSTAAPATR